ncbi:unnamed protein product [Adineta steineri]|uniref:GST N-terminal domain-containing protein n=1 Tax=Adineta steineri TaxID=433720 RepID=A0A819SNL4_9BILA|nr:unnamed protein product [Adineta steineri]CAF4059294.1 unnamed protein product [Adineta steineri]
MSTTEVLNDNMKENQTRRALLVIDVQQDFISPNGPFQDSHMKADHIVSNLTTVLPHFRKHNGIVIWIKADYSNPQSEPKYLTRSEGKQYENIPLNDAYLSSTHKTFPLCIAGTDGQKFIPEIDLLIKPDQDIVLTKTFYSAFTNTDLTNILKGVQEVHICGLVTNVCVQATTADAFFHGYKVFVWTDCLGYRHRERHEIGLKYMQQWYATMITSHQYYRQSITTTATIKSVLYFVNGSISSWRVMIALYEKNIDFEAKPIRVMSKPKETKSAEFFSINPRGLTPTLVDTDGSIITESLAILHYLEKYYPNTLSLMPVEKADYIKVLQRIQESQNLINIYEPLEEIVLKTLEHEQSSHEDLVLKTLEMMAEELVFWEMYLIKTTFIACDQFTLADCAFYPVIAYLIHRGLNIERFPAIVNYVNIIKTKTSAINAHPKDWTETGGEINIFKVVENILAKCNEESG